MNNYGTLKNLLNLLKNNLYIDVFNRFTNLWYCNYTVGELKEKINTFNFDIQIIDIKINGCGVDVTINCDLEIL
jgi:hypothetical protein